VGRYRMFHYRTRKQCVPVCLSVLFLALSIYTYEVRPLFAAEVLIDEVVASVEQTAITRNQVALEARFLLAQSGQSWSGRIPPKLMESVLKRLISMELIYQEMERSGLGGDQTEDPVELNKISETFRKSFSSEEDFKAFLTANNLSESALGAMLHKAARIESFMQRRMGLWSRVSEDDVTREITTRNAKGGMTADSKEMRDLRSTVRRELEQAKYKAVLSRWLDELAERNRVLQFVQFTDDEPALAPVVRKKTP